MSGPQSTPAGLPGFTLLRGIGAGGFAEVFLYREDRLGREVAVKILRAEHLSAESLRQFEVEANLMARTSAHPCIVSIYNSGVAADGRPYIAMEYYPPDHFGVRARNKLAVAEVLRIGVQVASAVETAHRAGIMHRDIKPANILTSEYGRPGLTDFGISGVRLGQQVEATAGVTLAFASPDVLNAKLDAGNELSDIYSLTATLYTLVAGRSPFWIPGGDNRDEAVSERAVNGGPPALDRPDMSPALNHLLQQGMAVDPSHRPPSTLAFARQLQDIEQQLYLSPTPIEVRDAAPPDGSAPMVPRAVDDGPDEGTRRALPKVVSWDEDSRGTTDRTNLRVMGSRPTPPATAALPTRAEPDASAHSVTSPPATTVPTGHHDEEGRDTTVARRPPPFGAVIVAARDTRKPMVIGAVMATAALVLIGGFLVLRTKEVVKPVVESRAPMARPVTSEAFPDTPAAPQGVTALLEPDGRLSILIPARAPNAPSVSYRLQRTDHNGASWPSGQSILDAAGASDAREATVVAVDGFKYDDLPCVKISTTVSSRVSDPTGEICATAVRPNNSSCRRGRVSGGVTPPEAGTVSGSVAGQPCAAASPDVPTAEGRPLVEIPVGPPPATLVTTDLRVGDGAVVSVASTVTVHYVGLSCSTGKQFDASWDRGTPAPFPLNNVIPGWTQGLPGMKVGGRRLLVIPPPLAYGNKPTSPNIAPGETLVFVIDLIAIDSNG